MVALFLLAAAHGAGANDAPAFDSALMAEAAARIAAGNAPGALDLLLGQERECAMDPACNALVADAAMRAGRYADATIALERLVLQQPQNAGAWLDLAIASARLGDAAGALEALDHLAGHFDPPPAIRRVMEDLRSRLVRPVMPPFRLRANVSAGHDSNANGGFSTGTLTLTPGGAPVELPLDPAYRARADNFWSVSVDVAGRQGISNGQWEWYGAYSERRYARETPFNTREGAVGAGYQARGLAGTLAASGEWRRLEMGGTPLVDVPRLRLGYDSAWNWRGCSPGIAGEAELRRYASIPRHDGNIAWGEASVRCPLADGEIRAALRLGLDHARAVDRPGGDTRHLELALIWQRPFAAGREVSLTAYAGDSRDERGYNPLLENDARRIVDRLALRGEYSWPLGGNWRGAVIGEASRQQSNLPLFDLNRSLLLFGLRYQP